jgi:hypothetical protein
MNSSDTVHSDEIDLIDVWVILARHFKLFIATFLLVFIAGIVVIFTRTPAYDYTVGLELGGFRADNGSFDLVETPEAVMAALKSSIIPSVLQDYATAHPDFDPNSVAVKLDNQDKSDIVVLTIKAGLKRQQTVTDILNDIAKMLDAEHGNLLQQHVELTRQLLNSQIDQDQPQLDDLLKSRKKVTESGNSESKALTLLLLDDQISRLQDNLYLLKQKRDVGLVADIRMTHPLSPPQRSINPAGLSRIVKIILSFIGALFIGLCTTFFAHMLMLTRERMHS